MRNVFTITEAKARLSELISRLIYRKEKIVLTKKGKEVAVIIPFEEYQKLNKKGGGLIKARGVLAGLDREIEEMSEAIYEEREKEKSREVAL
jgi:prevent-host-death family protein